MQHIKREWERDELRLKLADIERDVAAMRCKLQRLDDVRERLLSEMMEAVNSCAGIRGRDPSSRPREQ